MAIRSGISIDPPAFGLERKERRGFNVERIVGANSYAEGFADGLASAPTDETPATITVISPTPDVVPGVPEPGGFPEDPELAKHTTIVLEVVDEGGLAYAGVFARFDGSLTRTPIFRRGAFEAGYSVHSFVEVIDAETTRLHVRADAGWQSLRIAFDVDVVDSGGNVT